MKVNYLLMAMFVLFISCEDQELEETKDSFKKRELTTAELSTLGNLCESLQDKRYDFETRASSTLRYRVKTIESTCARPTIVNRQIQLEFINEPGRSGGYYWQGPRNSSYFKDIVTDKTQPLSRLCLSFFAGESIENAYEQGRTRFEFAFNGGRNVNSVIIRTSVLRGDAYTSRQVEGFKVDINPRSRSYGHVIEREMARACGNGRDHHFRQMRI